MANTLCGRLTVVSGDERGRSYNLELARTTVGREADNDIVLRDDRVSRQHVVIERATSGDSYQLIDERSTNGTRLNSAVVTKGRRYELRDGDSVELGGFHLVFKLDAAPHAAPPRPTEFVNEDVARVPPPGGPTVVELPNHRAVTVGRDPTNGVPLDHPQVSRFHARLQRLPDGVLLVRDLNSTNGTFIDGQQLHGERRVAPGATLAFGPFRLLYQGGRLIRDTADGTIRIDCLQLGKTVAGGRTILTNITFSVLPREFVCLVGGSGAGKSTLLDAISGVRPATAGEVRYNGVDYYAQLDAYRSAIGYVPQDDIVPTELPVARALYYAAKLRLPPDTSEAEVRARVDEVLADMELTARRDVPIKNLSGGQRKRVSIGAELLAQPTLLFLDEPTSGLDPGLEERMMALLRKLADQGRTVVLITHATQNVDLCDRIAFLAPGGHLAYYGPPDEALAYFDARKFADIYTKIEREERKESLARRFHASPQYKDYVAARLVEVGVDTAGTSRRTERDNAATIVVAEARPPAAQQASTVQQFTVLSRRYLETIWRDTRNLLLLLGQAPVIALLIAIAYHNRILDMRTGSNGQARQLLFLLAIVAVWFGTSNAAREIVKETAIYARERRVNLKLGPYIASKFVVLSLLSGIQSSVLLVPLLVVRADTSLLPTLYLALVFAALSGIGMGLIISAWASNPDRANNLVPLVLIPQVMFSGVLVPLTSSTLVEGISHLMVTKWAFRALGSTASVDKIPGGLPPGDFSWPPVAYLLILAVFSVTFARLVAILQRRKDRAR